MPLLSRKMRKRSSSISPARNWARTRSNLAMSSSMSSLMKSGNFEGAPISMACVRGMGPPGVERETGEVLRSASLYAADDSAAGRTAFVVRVVGRHADRDRRRAEDAQQVGREPTNHGAQRTEIRVTRSTFG